MSFIEQLDRKIAEFQTFVLSVSPNLGSGTLEKAESSSIILTQLLLLRDRQTLPLTETPLIIPEDTIIPIILPGEQIEQIELIPIMDELPIPTQPQDNTLRNALLIGGALLLLI